MMTQNTTALSFPRYSVTVLQYIQMFLNKKLQRKNELGVEFLENSERSSIAIINELQAQKMQTINSLSNFSHTPVK